MSLHTPIKWCDSTLNIAMGCDGCELYNPKLEASDPRYKPDCYAKLLTDRYAGNKGYPEAFNIPKIFSERVKLSRQWSDLTGAERLDKPWLNGLPRIIFHGDMGDYWTKSLPVDWIHPYLGELASSPHQHLFLTKNPSRMGQCFDAFGPVPDRFWLGTSVTSNNTKPRVRELLSIKARNHFISYEPAWEWVDFSDVAEIYLGDLDQSDTVHPNLFIIGGQSGPRRKPFYIEWAERTIEFCRIIGASPFVKQLGNNPLEIKVRHEMAYPIILKDPKGGDWDEWPEHLRVRQMPQVNQ